MLASAGAALTVEYAKDQTNTSTTCAPIKTDTVGIITAIKKRAGAYDLLRAPTDRAIDTSIVIITAWTDMLIALTTPPTKSCRNMSPPPGVFTVKLNYIPD